MHWSESGHLFSNVLHGAHSSGGPIDPAVPETIFAAIKAATSTTTWLTHLSPTVNFTGVSLKNLSVANEPEVPSVGGAALGTGVGQPLGINSALVVTLKTARSGPAFRGRTYLGGLVASTLTDPFNFSPTVGADAVAFMTGVSGVLTSNGFPLVVAQRALQAGTHADGSPWAARPASTQPVTTISIVNPRVDSQRRRSGR
jgi:hypothetical protein